MKGEATVTREGPSYRVELPSGVVQFIPDDDTEKLIESHRECQALADAVLAVIVHRLRGLETVTSSAADMPPTSYGAPDVDPLISTLHGHPYNLNPEWSWQVRVDTTRALDAVGRGELSRGDHVEIDGRDMIVAEVNAFGAELLQAPKAEPAREAVVTVDGSTAVPADVHEQACPSTDTDRLSPSDDQGMDITAAVESVVTACEECLHARRYHVDGGEDGGCTFVRRGGTEPYIGRECTCAQYHPC